MTRERVVNFFGSIWLPDVGQARLNVSSIVSQIVMPTATKALVVRPNNDITIRLSLVIQRLKRRPSGNHSKI